MKGGFLMHISNVHPSFTQKPIQHVTKNAEQQNNVAKTVDSDGDYDNGAIDNDKGKLVDLKA